MLVAAASAEIAGSPRRPAGATWLQDWLVRVRHEVVPPPSRHPESWAGGNFVGLSHGEGASKSSVGRATQSGPLLGRGPPLLGFPRSLPSTRRALSSRAKRRGPRSRGALACRAVSKGAGAVTPPWLTPARLARAGSCCACAALLPLERLRLQTPEEAHPPPASAPVVTTSYFSWKSVSKKDRDLGAKTSIYHLKLSGRSRSLAAIWVRARQGAVGGAESLRSASTGGRGARTLPCPRGVGPGRRTWGCELASWGSWSGTHTHTHILL